MDTLDLEGPWGALAYLPHLLRGRKSNLFFFFFFNLLGLCCWVFAAEPELSLAAVTGGSSLVVVLRLLIAVASPVAGPGLYIAGSAIWHMGLDTKACGIFQDQGSNPCPLRWQEDSQPLDHQRSPKPTLVLVWSQVGYSFSLLETSLPSAGALIILGPWLQGLNV